MARRKKQASNPGQQQPYDNMLKSFLEGEEKKRLPYFYEGVEYLETLNIEVLRTPLRVDRVYKVLYNGAIHILHLEFESGASENMAERLHEYHAFFRSLFDCPVISVIVYPFECKMAEPPLQEQSGDWLISYFDFKVLPLWKEKAEQYLQQQLIDCYALLPAMGGANRKLLDEAIDQMVEYYKENQARLAKEFVWFHILLQRAEIVSEEEKAMIQQRLDS